MADFLESMSQPRGDTRTDRALKMTRDELLIADAGARDFTPKAIVIVTDGGDKRDTTAKFAEQRARELKDMDGATIVALGVGDKVDQYELRQLASDPDHAFLVTSYDDIIGYVKSAADAVCTGEWCSNWSYAHVMTCFIDFFAGYWMLFVHSICFRTRLGAKQKSRSKRMPSARNFSLNKMRLRIYSN